MLWQRDFRRNLSEFRFLTGTKINRIYGLFWPFLGSVGPVLAIFWAIWPGRDFDMLWKTWASSKIQPIFHFKGDQKNPDLGPISSGFWALWTYPVADELCFFFLATYWFLILAVASTKNEPFFSLLFFTNSSMYFGCERRAVETESRLCWREGRARALTQAASQAQSLTQLLRWERRRRMIICHQHHFFTMTKSGYENACFFFQFFKSNQKYRQNLFKKSRLHWKLLSNDLV